MSTIVRPAASPPLGEGLAAFGGRTALVAGGREISYRELGARVDDRAAALGDGRRLVVVRAANDLESLVNHLAVQRGGHVGWLVPAGAPDRSAHAEAHFDPDVVLAVDDGHAVIDERRDGSAHALHPELALLMSTSGSTGAPRLVRLSHDNLRSNAEAIATYLGITDRDRAITSLPFHYCYGLSVVSSHLLRGAGLLLTDRSVTDPAFWELARDGGATSFAGVPHTFELLERVGFADMDLPALRYVTQAGGRLAPERVRGLARLGARRGWRFVVMYGQTEATARMAYLPPELAESAAGAIGVPIPGGSFEIHPVPEAGDDGGGELVYRGPNVMLGYAHGPGDLARGREIDELRTGDLGRLGPGGLYEVVGRRSRFLKLFGLRIDLDEVERMLARDGIEAVCAGGDDRLVVAVAGGAAPACLAASLGGRLGVPASRVAVRAVDEIPRLPNGKPDYVRLAAPETPTTAGAPPPAAVGSPATATVAAILAEALGRPEVGDDDTFAGLGGDSLSYVEVSLALEAELGRLPEGWPRMTVRELAAVRGHRGRGARVEMNVALRAAAILLVVASHMTDLWPAGGAHLLLALAGFSFARFPLAALDAPRRLARAAGAIGRIALPASAWIALMVVLTGGYSLGAVLLVNNYTGAQELGSDGRWHYWFIEALVQILIVLTALLAIPAVRRAERRRPFAFVLVLLGGALLARFEVLAAGADDNLVFRPHSVVWLFLLGWAIHLATTRGRRLALSALIVASVPGFFATRPQELVVIGGLLLLTWVPVAVVPRSLVPPLGLIAAASLYIYLTHWQVFPPLQDALPTAPALVATVAVGVVAWCVAERVVAATGRLRRRVPVRREPAGRAAAYPPAGGWA